MAATKKNGQKLDALAAFFDEGAYTELYADKDGAVAAGYGTAEGCPAYALAQNGGALTAAAFLSEFVPTDIPWGHLDIAGPAFNSGAAYDYTPSGGTGAAVRTLIALAHALAN